MVASGARMEGRDRKFGMDMYTLLYLKWTCSRVQGTLLCCAAGWMGGEFRGEWIQVHAWLSPFAVHLNLSQPC